MPGQGHCRLIGMPTLDMPLQTEQQAKPGRARVPSRKPAPKRWPYLAGVVLLLAAAVGVWRLNTKPEKPAWTPAEVKKGAVRKTIAATGTLQALTTVNVGSQVSGTIAQIYVDFNTPVKKGQIIAQLDASQLQAQLTQAEANYSSALAAVQTAQSAVQSAEAAAQASDFNVDRTKSVVADAQRNLDLTQQLVTEGVTARRDLDTAKATVAQAAAQNQQAAAQANQAKAQAQSAKSQLIQARAQAQQASAQAQVAALNVEHTIIRAPIDGVVVARNVDVGQTVAASLQAPTLFLIANDLKHMQVLANIDEADIGQLGPSSRVTFAVDAFPQDTFNGRISQIRLAPQTLQNVVTYTAVIDVDNPDLKLKPGMTANVTAIVAEKENVLTVPNAALRFRPENVTDRPKGPTVWKIDGEQLTPVRVRLGITDGVVTEVLSAGLQEGDDIATPSAQTAKAGAAPARNPMMPMGGGGMRRR